MSKDCSHIEQLEFIRVHMLLISAVIYFLYASGIKTSLEFHYSLLISHFECTAIRIGRPISQGLFFDSNSIVFKSCTRSTFLYRTCPRSILHNTNKLQFPEIVMKQFLIASWFLFDSMEGRFLFI